uniref:uncharacterized protein LOC120335990 n=1 Tax=Styela clava TaxID=7725 RepID=UPI00193A69E7|nr:uncharacterized protein LOC120335990 [Styela clava]
MITTVEHPEPPMENGITLTAESGCDLTWILYNSNLALTIISDPMKSVPDAKSSCTAIGKSLVSITTNELDSLLTTKLSQNGTINYWTSGSDSETEGSWKWGDGTAFSKNDSNWMRWPLWGNEPNGTTSENCLMKYAEANYKWVDTICTTKSGYICQKNVSSGSCGSDVCLNKGSCTIKKPRYTCTCNAGYFGTKCEKDFITISTTPTKRDVKRGESIDVQLHIASYNENVDVNVRNQNNVKIKFVTTSDINSSNPSTTLTINIGPIEVSSATISYKFEAGPQSNNSSYSRIVTLMLVVNDACDSSPCKNGANCQYTTAEPYYICTCRPEYNGTTCEEPTYNLYKNCKYHVNYYKKKTFGDANTTCNSLGGSVAMMKTDAIQDFVESQIIDQYGEGGTIEFWIGAYKPNTDWLWVDDTPITNSKWAWSSVSQGNGYLFMSSYGTTRDNMKWINNDGSRTQGYVCEIPSMQNFRNYKFEVFNEGKSYDAAKAVCEGRNTWLVEIKDEETQDAVRQLTTATNYPQTVRSINDNHCGASKTSDKKWYNSDCKVGLRYVCQSDLTWIFYNSNLALTIISDPMKSFADARSACTAIGKSLVSITTNALDSLLTTKLSQNGTINYWTSGSDSETEGIWKWGDGTTFSKTDANW